MFTVILFVGVLVILPMVNNRVPNRVPNRVHHEALNRVTFLQVISLTLYPK